MERRMSPFLRRNPPEPRGRHVARVARYETRALSEGESAAFDVGIVLMALAVIVATLAYWWL
jgi:hypothetical protein